MPRREVVGAVEHDVGTVDERAQLRLPNARRYALDAHVGIDGCQTRRSGVDFGAADIGRRKQGLPLQIGEIDVVGVAQRQRADACCGEEVRRRVAETADADDERVRRGELVLCVRTELRQQDMPAIPKKLGVIHSKWAARADSFVVTSLAPRCTSMYYRGARC